MERKDWKVVKLGDVCDIISGSTPKTKEPTFWEGKHFWITPAELKGDKWVSSTERTLTDEGVKNAHLQILPVGTVLLSSRAPIGKIAITTVPMYCNQGFKNLVCSDLLKNEYLYWYLLYKEEYIKSLGVGATFKEISKTIVASIPIPVPPLPVQARIVDELDCLQGILSKKRQQLAEYHSLAQAIFHQMFGDPVVNEKGWEVKRLGEVCELKAGKNIKASDLKKSHIEGTYPCYGGNDIRGYINRYSHIENHIIIGRQGALCGNVVYACAPFYATEHAVVVTIKQTMQELWLFYTLKYLNLNQYAKGVAQPGLAVGTLNKVFIPIPPSHLQEEFVSYVNIIHNQCERLALSIHETEDLLACRMETLLACRMETLLNCPQA